MIDKFIPQLVKRFIYENRYIIKEKSKKHKKYLRNLLKDNKENLLEIDDENNWIKKLNKITYSSPDLIEIGEAFVGSKIEVLQDRTINDLDVIAICVEKNDFIKLQNFIYHHRSLGINKFVILDNNSDDGSVEWLLKQEDVILLQTKEQYKSYRRVGWINRIIAHYGYNRWYLVVDSDELLVYDDCENKTIQDVIKYFEKRHICRGRAIMLDMYAKPEYYSKNSIDTYYAECRFFDSNSYSVNKRKLLYEVNGGPRERIFKLKTCLTKHPLFYFTKKDVYRAHFLYPCNRNSKGDLNLALKHYKFLPGEIKKYEKIVREGNYFKGSREYKKYLEVMKENCTLNFICDNTEEYKSSR